VKFAGAIGDQVKPFLACFLALWWTIGAFVLTFQLYKFTGNGYFACWVGAITSILWACECNSSLKKHAETLQSKFDTTPISMLILCSVVELVAASIQCDEHGRHCVDEVAYAVAVGVVSLLFCILSLVLPQFNNIFSICLLVWWIPGVYVLTFSSYSGAFTTTGNGYFSTWGALLFAAGFFLSEWMPESAPLTLPMVSKKSSKNTDQKQNQNQNQKENPKNSDKP
jgi:hypothetical protein